MKKRKLTDTSELHMPLVFLFRIYVSGDEESKSQKRIKKATKVDYDDLHQMTNVY